MVQDVLLDRMFVVCCLDDQTCQSLLEEETILDAKQAILSVLTEECADHAGVLQQTQACVPCVASRLESVLHASGIAKQVLEHLHLPHADPNDKNDVMHLDANKARTSYQQTH
jgi:hypothetical protein